MKFLTNVKECFKKIFKEKSFNQNEWEVQNAASKRDYYSKESILDREIKILTTLNSFMIR